MNRTYIALIFAALLIIAGCSSEKSKTTAPINVTSPDGLTVTAQGSSSVLVAWSDNSNNEDGFRIERSIFRSNSWAAVGASGQNSESFIDTGLVEGTVYSYFVRAFDDGNLSASSDTLNVGTRLRSPENVVVTPLSVMLVSMAWSDVSNAETSYRIERKAGAGRFVAIASLAANTTTLRDSGLTANTEYTYHIRALKDSLSSEWSSNAVATTLQFPPNPPIQIRISVANVNTIQLIWRDNSSDEEGFHVERSLDNINWELVNTLTSTSFSDSNLSEGTTFRYRVCSFIGDSKSDYAGPISATTSLFSATGLSASRESETSISIAWSDISSAELGYQVQRKLGQNAFVTLGMVLPAGSESFVNVGLERDMTYTFKVRAVKDTIASAWSNESSAHTTLQTPNPPSGLTTQGDFDWPNEARLAWTDNSSGDRNERGFVIQKSPNGNDTWTHVDSIGADITTTSETNLESESIWYFRVFTYNEFGVSANSNVSSCSIAGIPPAPSGLTAESIPATAGGAILRWTDNSSSEAGFTIDVSENGNTGWLMHDSIAANTVSWVVRNLPVESTRYFRVLARNRAGHSAYTNVASTVIVGIPPAPARLVGSAPDYRAVILDWEDHSLYESGFYIERREATSFQWRLLRTVQPNVVHHADSTVVAERRYIYRVRSFNDSGPSDSTNNVTIQVPASPPTTPTDLTVTALYVDKISVGWYDRAINEDSYFVERKGPDEDEFSIIGAFEADANFMIDSSCAPNSWYTYRVYCENEAGLSSLTDTVGALTWPLELFTEDFEDHQMDAFPGDPWVSFPGAGTSWAHVDDSLTHDSEKSHHFYDPDSGFTRVYSYADAGEIAQGTVTAWLYIPRGTNFDFFGANAATFFTFQLVFGSNDTIRIWDGATLNSWGTYPTNEWFKIDIDFDMDTPTYQVKINDEVICDPSAPRAAGQQLVGGIAWENVRWRNVFIDDITVVRAWEPQRMAQSRRRPTRVDENATSTRSLDELRGSAAENSRPQR